LDQLENEFAKRTELFGPSRIRAGHEACSKTTPTLDNVPDVRSTLIQAWHTPGFYRGAPEWTYTLDLDRTRGCILKNILWSSLSVCTPEEKKIVTAMTVRIKAEADNHL